MGEFNMNAKMLAEIINIASEAVADDDGLFDDVDSPISIMNRGKSMRACEVVSVASKLVARDLLLEHSPEDTGPILVVAGVLGEARALLLQELFGGASPKLVRFLGDPDPADWIAFESIAECLRKIAPTWSMQWLVSEVLEAETATAVGQDKELSLSLSELTLLRAAESMGVATDAVSVVGQYAFSRWQHGRKLELEGILGSKNPTVLARVHEVVRSRKVRK